MAFHPVRFAFIALFALVGSAALYSEAEAPLQDAEALLQAVQKLQSDPTAAEGLGTALGTKIEELKKAIEGSKSSLAEIEAKLPEIRNQLDAARSTQVMSEKSLKVYEGIVELLGQQAVAPDPAPAPLEAAPEAPSVPNPGLPRKESVAKSISFNQDVRHILSNNCFTCHGPDKNTRKANLRLDEEAGALADLGGGRWAIVPGNPDQSELFKRIVSEDESERMPPVKMEKTLKPEEIEILRQWIAEGAEYEKHWALIPDKRAEPPAQLNRADWTKNPIDQFLLARMEKAGLEPNPEADKRTLIRRATLTLTGLLPTPEEIADFLNDTSSDAYEKVINRLFASPRYAEHMARIWLDASRYADTNGYHIDNVRNMWPWRNWVIDSYRKNKRFDEFTIEQLAGDLLPNPSLDQQVASGFNRNHMINFEGGAIPEEYLMNYHVDRVNTTSTVWMGLTVNCAQCHDHKYDPISMKEFYQLYAFFNQVPENGLDGQKGNSEPLVRYPSPGQAMLREEIRAQLASLEAQMLDPLPLIDSLQNVWETRLRETLSASLQQIHPTEYKSTGGSQLKLLEDGSILSTETNPEKDVYEIQAKVSLRDITAVRLVALTDPSMKKGGPGRSSNGNFVLSEFEVEIAPVSDPAKRETVKFSRATADYSQDGFDVARAVDGNAETGWAVSGNTRHEERTATFFPDKTFGFEEGTILTIRLRHEAPFSQHGIGRFALSISNDPAYRMATLSEWSVNGPFLASDSKEAFEKDFGPEAKPIDLNETYPDGRFKWVLASHFQDGKQNELVGDVAATYLYRTIYSPSDRKVEFLIGSNDGVKLWVNGAEIYGHSSGRTLKLDQDRHQIDIKKGENHILLKITNHGASYGFSFRLGDQDMGALPREIETILGMNPEDRSEEQTATLKRHYRIENSEEFRKLRDEIAKVKAESAKIENSIPTTMVMRQAEEPMETFIRIRGEYDKLGDKVVADTPAALNPFPADQPRNRLGLAKWLTDPANPLTARVTINRMWERLFGNGLVKTVEDFGIQGEWPVNQALLDWLSVEFIESGWDVQHMLRLMMTSAAYRQSSAASGSEDFNKDPENRLISRGPRFRLDAEEIRDNALLVSGLLVEKVGGPSVKPYQPPGLWEEVAYGGDEYTGQVFEQDTGENLYRRSMYTFWKRQAPPPSMQIFDAPNREICTVKRSRTNTPLQALALMNDPQYVEASRWLAQRMMKQSGEKPEDRVMFAFELATARKPTERECAVLMNVFNTQIEKYRADQDGAIKLISIGESKRDENLDVAELAAWTCVANMILNLDETVTKG